MRNNKAIRTIALGAALLGLCSISPSANAAPVSQSGTTTTTVTMPEYMVLHYYSAVALNFSATSSSASQTGSPLSATWTTLGDTSTTLAASATEVGPSSAKITLKNAWAIAGLSSSGTATVSITGTDFSATRVGSTSKIGVTGYGLASTNGVSGAVSGATVTTLLRGVTGQTQTVGDVNMTLNFGNTTESGAHAGSFTITAQTI
ncbi:MAG: hypothetical protein HGB23_03025 [Chlorobiaceae bacterium]|nr:hypothetical protein [Chlorobiaceae bacterium]